MNKKLYWFAVIVALIIMSTVIYIFIARPLIIEELKNDNCYKVIEQEPMLLSPEGIAVDNKGNIYIGDSDVIHFGRILVFNKEFEYQHTIKTQNYGSISFDINNENKLEVAYVRSDKIKVYDTNACIINERSDKNSEIYHEYRQNKKSYVTKEGTKYNIEQSWGYVKVIKQDNQLEEQVLYSMPIKYWAINIGKGLVLICFLSIVVISIYISNKERINNFFKSKN